MSAKGKQPAVVQPLVVSEVRLPPAPPAKVARPPKENPLDQFLREAAGETEVTIEEVLRRQESEKVKEVQGGAYAFWLEDLTDLLPDFPTKELIRAAQAQFFSTSCGDWSQPQHMSFGLDQVLYFLASWLKLGRPSPAIPPEVRALTLARRHLQAVEEECGRKLADARTIRDMAQTRWIHMVCKRANDAFKSEMAEKRRLREEEQARDEAEQKIRRSLSQILSNA
jgi:hypothetical protein